MQSSDGEYTESLGEEQPLPVVQVRHQYEPGPAAAEAKTREPLALERLLEHGAAQADLQRLREADYATAAQVHMATTRQLQAVRGLSEARVERLKRAADAVMRGRCFSTAAEQLMRRRTLLRVSTGSREFDAVLEGGLEGEQICEVFGEYRTGKTQLCHTVAVLAQEPTVGGAPAGRHRVVYVDTEDTFRPARAAQIAQARGLDPRAALDGIVVARVHNHEQQAAALGHLQTLLAQGRYSCVVVDSLTHFFRQDFRGRGELADRQQCLGQQLNRLGRLAREFGVLVLVTNQVQAVVDGTALFAEARRPVGGHVLAHASTTRLALRKGRGEQRVVRVCDSPGLPEAEAVFALGPAGVCDAAD